MENRLTRNKGNGSHLPDGVRTYMERSFGADFSLVRVHTNTDATEMNRALNSQAFTHDQDIYFGAGKNPGKDVLTAHELTHVVQQAGKNNIQQRSIVPKIQLQPKPRKKTLDDKALKIINAAQNSKTAIDKRAIQTVKDIINTYYPTQAKLVKKVVYKESEPGLRATAATFPNAKGTITVGKYFVTHTTKKGFARRVLQVDHELEHVRQQRRGLGGPHRADLREFLAFTREALSPELPGTGRVSHSTRVALIDAALKRYYKLDKDQKTKYSNERDRLLKARKEHAAKSGRKHKPPPGSSP